MPDMRDDRPDWERLLAAERHLQALVPGSVLVGGASPLVEVIERLARAEPSDLAEVDLRTYRNLAAPWTDWAHVTARGRHWAGVLAALVAGDAPRGREA